MSAIPFFDITAELLEAGQILIVGKGPESN
jgi:hypothetical protein